MLDNFSQPYLDQNMFRGRIKAGIDNILFKGDTSDALADAIYFDIYQIIMNQSCQPNYEKIRSEINNIVYTRMTQIESDMRNTKMMIDTTLIGFGNRLQSLETNFSGEHSELLKLRNEFAELKQKCHEALSTEIIASVPQFLKEKP